MECVHVWNRVDCCCLICGMPIGEYMSEPGRRLPAEFRDFPRETKKAPVTKKPSSVKTTNTSFWGWAPLVLTIMLFVVVAVGVIFVWAPAATQGRQNAVRIAYLKGQRTRIATLPITANPYVGKDVGLAEAFFDGYMDPNGEGP